MLISKFNGSVSMQLDGSYRPVPDQIRRDLGQLDGGEDFAYLLYFVPDDAGWPDAPEYDESKFVDNFMQSAGSAEAMSIEIKRLESDGEYRQYAVGRPEDDPAAPDVMIPFAENTLLVRPSEVFDADEAARIYYHYFQTNTVPDGLTLRELDLRWGKTDELQDPLG